MTVGQLIEVLRTHLGDLRVVVNGYEEGFDDLSPDQISLVRIALNTGVDDWQGQHGETDESPPHAASTVTTVDALVLRRVSN